MNERETGFLEKFQQHNDTMKMRLRQKKKKQNRRNIMKKEIFLTRQKCKQIFAKGNEQKLLFYYNSFTIFHTFFSFCSL